MRFHGAALAFVTALLFGAVPGAAHAATFTAYVANCGRSVTPIDVATDTAGPKIPIGDCSDGIAITPDGATAYVANYPFPNPQGSVTPIDLATNTAGAPIPVGPHPAAIAVNPAGTTAYVTTDNGVVPITVATNQPQSAIPVPDAYQMAITPDGETAYVTTILMIQYGNGTIVNESTVRPINLATNVAEPPINVAALGITPRGVAIAPDGKTAYVATGDADTVLPIAVATNTLLTPIPVGHGAFRLAITPDGSTAYVSDYFHNLVTPIALASGTAGKAIPVGLSPYGIAITPDGATAYVANGQSNSVTPIAVATNTPGAQIPIGDGGPNTIAIRTTRPRTSTSLTCSPQGIVVGQATTCTATVTDVDAGTAVPPSGSVTFTSTGAGTFAGAPCSLSGSGGVASCQVTYTPSAVQSGQHSLSADYAGDGVHTGGSGQATVSVSLRSTITAVSCVPAVVRLGHSTLCTTTVTDSSPGLVTTPTGTISFTTTGTGSFSNGAGCALDATGTCSVMYAPTIAACWSRSWGSACRWRGIGTPHGQMSRPAMAQRVTASGRPGKVRTDSVTADYSGDAIHSAGDGSTPVTIVRRRRWRAEPS